MALKLRNKDIKKSSYYVWFLGAKESKGLRGPEYIKSVVKHLEQREKDVEPFKVTLQVSHKGLKIIQNVVSQGAKSSKPKNETIKHFIPHNTITCVYQDEDVIACILLLFNPVTKCPLHVHAYRCDSLETATLLKNQLQTLIDRPDNQKKFAEIESRLQKPAKETIKKVESSVGSDTGTSTRESESSEERFVVENGGVSTLYDSVAAELREKLNKNKVPILLPPRDYDTVHRQKGNLTGIELRRCLNENIVGQNVKGRRLESSGGSSGIGSDHPPSPDSPEAPDSRFNAIDNQSTSDEDWNGDPAESTVYLMHGPAQITLPRPNNRDKSPPDRYSASRPKYDHAPLKHADKSRYAQPASPKIRDKPDYNKYSPSNNHNNNISKLEKKKSYESMENEYYHRDQPIKYHDENTRYKNRDFNAPIPKIRQKYSNDQKYFEETSRFYEENSNNSHRRQKQSCASPKPEVSPQDRFKDAKEKFLSMEKEKGRAEPPISPTTNHGKHRNYNKHFDYEEEVEEARPMPMPAPRHFNDDVRYRRDRSDKFDPKRRSMFSLIEEEHRKNSSEIAKELKRRSYLENNNYDDYNRDNGGNNYNFSKSSVELDKVGGEMKFVKNQKGSGKNCAGYRHSYAEPKLRMEKGGNGKKHFAEMLHRTNSVTNNGRVGIASVHPY